jgi:hypothetical protein
MSNEQTKKPWQSGAIITALLGLVFGVCEYLGVFVDPELQAIIQSEDTVEKITSAEQVKGLVTVTISIAFAYFRLRARRAIEGGVDVLKQPFQWVGNLFKRKKKEEA